MKQRRNKLSIVFHFDFWFVSSVVDLVDNNFLVAVFNLRWPNIQILVISSVISSSTTGLIKHFTLDSVPVLPICYGPSNFLELLAVIVFIFFNFRLLTSSILCRADSRQPLSQTQLWHHILFQSQRLTWAEVSFLFQLPQMIIGEIWVS